MKQLARLLFRSAILFLAAALFFAASTFWAASIQPSRRTARVLLIRRRRPPQPQLRGVPGFAGEILLVAGIALAARKILRLRLSD